MYEGESKIIRTVAVEFILSSFQKWHTSFFYIIAQLFNTLCPSVKELSHSLIKKCFPLSCEPRMQRRIRLFVSCFGTIPYKLFETSVYRGVLHKQSHDWFANDLPYHSMPPVYSTESVYVHFWRFHQSWIWTTFRFLLHDWHLCYVLWTSVSIQIHLLATKRFLNTVHIVFDKYRHQTRSPTTKYESLHAALFRANHKWGIHKWIVVTRSNLNSIDLKDSDVIRKVQIGQYSQQKF